MNNKLLIMNDNKRIAFNTGVIYIKLILSSIIGLYTSRVVLDALGAEDFGLYTVVGGIVTFLNVIGTTMVSVSYRYIAVEFGKGENGNINKIYNTVYLIHIVLALMLIFFGEIVGLFYIDNYLNVLPEKLADARFVLHVSLLTTAISVMSVPSNGLIIAREKFVFTSIVEILSTVIKLALVIMLAHSMGNRLRLYALSVAAATLLIRLSYYIYCKHYEKEIVRWKLNKDKSDYKSVFRFAWWSLFGAAAYTGKEQGSGMVINYFFGTTLNAAFGLASQINNYCMMFTKGLSQAAIPQIMKSHGAGDNNRADGLVYTISRLSTLIYLIMVVPIIISMDGLLGLWLGTPPVYTSIFSVFLMGNAFVALLGAGFDARLQSTGDIKNNELVVGLVYLSIIPIIYLLYKLGYPPYINVIVLPILTVVVKAFQCFLLKRQTTFKISLYIKESLIPSCLAGIVSFIPAYISKQYFEIDGVRNTIICFIVSMIWTIVCVYLIGFSKSEKQALVGIIKNTINKKKYE